MNTKRLPATSGVYIHFPFCRRRCHYCDFNTYAVPEIPIDAYTRAVIAELEQRGHHLAGRQLASVFFGGGTPGLWGAEPVGRVLEAVRQFVGPLDAHAEVTLEVNPGECSENTLAAYRRVGVNRISFGVQALTDRLLLAMDRIHSAAEALDAMQAVRQAGFERWSADLIFGLPGQRVDRWLRDLGALLDQCPPHISVYNLMVEPGTPLHLKVRDGKVRLPREATQVRMMNEGWALLAERGYRRYEISNFSMPGGESIHNLLYWTGRPYLGIGAGAHGFTPAPETSPLVGIRTSNARKYSEYIERALNCESRDTPLPAEPTVVFTEDIDAATHLRERIMTGLRLTDGLDLADTERSTGLNPAEVYSRLASSLQSEGLLTTGPTHWRLPENALFISDAIFQRFF